MQSTKAMARGAALCVFMAGAGLGAAHAQNLDLFKVALCDPPYTMDLGQTVYDQLEKSGKPETRSMVAFYKLPSPLQRDGFVAKEAMVTQDFLGLAIDGQRAEELAARYKLKATKTLGATKSFERALPAEQQPEPSLFGPGKVSIVARESAAMPGQTLFGCEFVTDANRKAMDELLKDMKK